MPASGPSQAADLGSSSKKFDEIPGLVAEGRVLLQPRGQEEEGDKSLRSHMRAASKMVHGRDTIEGASPVQGSFGARRDMSLRATGSTCCVVSMAAMRQLAASSLCCKCSMRLRHGWSHLKLSHGVFT